MKFEKIVFICTSSLCAILLGMALINKNYNQLLPIILLLLSQLGMLFFNKQK